MAEIVAQFVNLREIEGFEGAGKEIRVSNYYIFYELDDYLYLKYKNSSEIDGSVIRFLKLLVYWIGRGQGRND